MTNTGHSTPHAAKPRIAKTMGKARIFSEALPFIKEFRGKTVVVKHGPKFEVLAENQLDEAIDATPSIVGDTIYVRSGKHLYCIAEK